MPCATSAEVVQVVGAGPGDPRCAVGVDDLVCGDVDDAYDLVVLLCGDDLSAVRCEERVIGDAVP